MTAASVARDCGMVQMNEKLILLKSKHDNFQTTPNLYIEGIGEEIDLDIFDFQSNVSKSIIIIIRAFYK